MKSQSLSSPADIGVSSMAEKCYVIPRNLFMTNCIVANHSFFLLLLSRARRVESPAPSSSPDPEIKQLRCGTSASASALWLWWDWVTVLTVSAFTVYEWGEWWIICRLSSGGTWQLGAWGVGSSWRKIHSELRWWQNSKDLGLQEQTLHEDPVCPWTLCYLSG